MAVVIETSIGDFTVDLYVKDRPNCCLNFLKLCKLKKYTFHLFHTVQRNYVAQSGDPTGTGTEGESVWGYLGAGKYFDVELRPAIKHNKKGLISMVSDGNNRHGSQFLITLTDSSDYLDKQNHSVFGEISEGIEVVDKFNDTITDKDDKPYRNIRLFHTVIIDDPFPDPPGLLPLIPQGSPIHATQQDDDKRVEYNEELDEEKGMTGEELLERYKEREAKTNAKLLQIIGDIPDADIAPPENVLFVCKLNPVTTDEDLEIIFSKFGAIKCCEIIRDYQTDDSKGYAFIEFENTKDCEKAYLKMDNVLIDDRRIHVDFSQSVSKLQWKQHKGFAFWKDRRQKKPVDEIEEEDEPQYNIKDFEKKNTQHYDYVFDDENLAMSGGKIPDGKKKSKDKKKEKKKYKNDSSSPDNVKSKSSRHRTKKSSDDDDDGGNKRRMRKRHDTTSSDDDKNDERKIYFDMRERRMRREKDDGEKERRRSGYERIDRRREEEQRNERRRDRKNEDDRKRDGDRKRDRVEDRKRDREEDRKRDREEDRKRDREEDRKRYDNRERDKQDERRNYRNKEEDKGNDKRERKDKRQKESRRSESEEHRNGKKKR